MNAPDLTDCDREPIHVPGAIQPHGVMLVAARDSLEATHAAGDAPACLGRDDWRGRALGELLGDELALRIGRATQSDAAGGFCGQFVSPGGAAFDVSAHQAGEHMIIELEPGSAQPRPASILLGVLEAAGASFERAPNLQALCERAAIEFRKLIGFDRVMIYRFLDDQAGAVLAEDRDPALPSFLHHHFPGSDIPAQARALYVRNLTRVIPDVSYTPAPLTPAWSQAEPLDMSDCALRSVSPIHVQYLRNMGVGASASISIVKDGALWGLVACHHAAPRLIPYDLRAACRTLASGLSRQIRAKEEAEGYRERIRLRAFEDEIVAGFNRNGALDANLAQGLDDLRSMMGADGVAVLRAGELHASGAHPHESEIHDLARWLLDLGAQPLATERLSELFAPAARYRAKASGLLGLTVSAEEPFVLMWFRAEQVEVVEWAGNPHKAMSGQGGALSPRASFEAWSEAVRGRSRRWTAAEVESAGRLREALLEARQTRRLRDLNLRLSESLSETEALLRQKEFLLKEVNHRVQNSLQLVSSFLGLQDRALGDATVHEAFEEARRRLSAVALVHRRLYRADQFETVDLARYVEDLVGEQAETMGDEWRGKITVDAAPVMVSADRAVTLGLILTELVINANKYAYDGRPGPIEISIAQDSKELRVVVADRGRGRHAPGSGFGTRMMAAMASQISATIDYGDNKPGLRAVVTAPMAALAGAG